MFFLICVKKNKQTNCTCIQVRIYGGRGLGHLSFWDHTSHAGVTYLSVCLKRVKICPSYV